MGQLSAGALLGRGYIFCDASGPFLSLGWATWALQCWELTEVKCDGRTFVKLQGKPTAENPSWRVVADPKDYRGLVARARAPCQLPEEVKKHGLVWEVLGEEKLGTFCAQPS